MVAPSSRAAPTALVRIWDAGTGRQRSGFSGHTGTIASVAVSPDGRRVASAGSDAVVRLWDIDSGRLLQTFKGHTDQICSVAFSPDGHTIASSSFDRTVKLWDANRIPQPLVLKISSASKDEVSSDCVACSPDGRRIAAGYADNAVRVWDAATGVVQWTLTGHDQPVHCVAFSPDGQTLASGAQDQTVRLWDLATRPASNPHRQPPGAGERRGVPPGRPPTGLVQRRRYPESLHSRIRPVHPDDPGPDEIGPCGQVQPRRPVHRLGRCRWAHQALGRRDRSASGDDHRSF